MARILYLCIVMPLLMTHYVMLQRNMLCTGITRAKKRLVLLGFRKALYDSVCNAMVAGHNTRLKERLAVEGMIFPDQERKQAVERRTGEAYG